MKSWKDWWAVEHRKSSKCLDGAGKFFEGGIIVDQPYRLFRTRQEAIAYIRKHYGYIRKDLRAYPHGNLMPVPVKVHVQLVRA